MLLAHLSSLLIITAKSHFYRVFDMSANQEKALPASTDDDLKSVEKAEGTASVASDTVAGTYVQSSGVTRMEAVHRAAHGKDGRATLYAVTVSIVVCAWAYSLDQSTTSNYSPFVTSYFSEHSSGLASLSISTSIISAVSKPFIAKIADITSRPYTYLLILFFYVVGYVIVASCHTLSAYIVGEVFVAIGGSGLDLLNDVIVADLTPLEWRGFVSSLLSTPFIINTWYAASIVSALSSGQKWRWGYGMFAIIMPAVLVPAIATLIYLDRRAHQLGVINIASSNAARREAKALAEAEGLEGPHGLVVAKAVEPTLTWMQSLKKNLIEIDAFGLILLGFGWSLLLLPFSLKTYAKGGWHNHSMIAMMVIGGVFLIFYVLYERFVAQFPSAPRRLLLNRTFICAVIIDFIYSWAGQLRGLYFSSYVYIITPWSVKNWTYFNNTLTLSLCVFGVVAGLIQRWTHRYKQLQIIGLSIKIIGIGILLHGTHATTNTGAIVMSQILIGMGGAFSVVSSRVASEASVPHQDTATVISLLSLWSKIGTSIGSATAAVTWSAKMPKYLREYLPADTTDAQVTKFFGSITSIKAYDMDSATRQGAILAYRKTLWYLIVPAVSISFIPLIAACLQTNYYLGKRHNAVMDVGPDGLPVEDTEIKDDVARTRTERFLRFWAGK